jgi:hypothetical protein
VYRLTVKPQNEKQLLTERRKIVRTNRELYDEIVCESRKERNGKNKR